MYYIFRGKQEVKQMGLFSKKENKKDTGMPKLPELPRLPNDFPEIDENYDSGGVHQLPSFPNSSMGDKFSQETIKNAVSGSEEEEDKESTEMHKPLIQRPNFEMGEMKKMPRPTYAGEKEIDSSRKVQKRNIEEETPKETGPVFIRIDKFEKALEIFKETKDKIGEIENLLDETKELKEREEEELSTWEKEIQDMKNQIEKVDRDIFSRI